MLIPSALIPTPPPNTTHIGTVVMGGVVSQLASSVAQLTHNKFLGHGYYYIGQDTGLSGAGFNRASYSNAHKTDGKFTETIRCIYNSTALSEWLPFRITYIPHDETDSQIDVVLKNFISTSTLDAGVRFQGGLSLEAVNNTRYTPINISSGFSGTTAPVNVTPTTSIRPLYLPLANRGQVVQVVLEATNIRILSFEISDRYNVEVTP